MNRFVQSLCHCDEECALYGDCCQDAAAHFATKTKSADVLDADSWKCLPLEENAGFGDEKVGLYFH